MKLCITGALGHIGSHLIRNLSVADLDRVYLVDNLQTQRYAALFDLPSDPPFDFREIDIRSDDLQPIIEDSDVLVHLAAVTDAEGSFDRQQEVEEINAQGLERVARACGRAGCALLFPSTTSVYGSQSSVVDEDCPEAELQPQSPYAESKIRGERLLAQLAGTIGLRHTTLRIGTIFGYSIGMRFHTAVNKFLWQAATGRAISVWRTALDQRRPYCGLNDACAAINFFVDRNLFEGYVYNIVSANLTVRELVEIIRAHVPDLSVRQVDSPIMNQLSYEASNDRSTELGIIYRDTLAPHVADVLRHLQHVRRDVDVRDV